jgi:uncharacterized OB-fold protein
MSASTSYNKPIPVPDEPSAPFFDGARRHELMLQQCQACKAWMWPVKHRCVECFSDQVTWLPASGRGTLHTFTVVHHAYPGFGHDVPYNVAVVELEEGVRMTADVVGCANSELDIGMAVEVVFDDLSATATLPRFRRAESAEPS